MSRDDLGVCPIIIPAAITSRPSQILAKVNINAFGLGTPLAIQAASIGDLEAIKTLHAAGADLKRRDSFTGQSPLQAAQEAGHSEMVRFLQDHGGDPATYAVRSLIRQMRSNSSRSGHSPKAPDSNDPSLSLTRQPSFLSPPSAIYLNRTVISTPAGDLSLEDVFNEVKQEGEKKISVSRELPMALTIMGLYWSPQVRAAVRELQLSRLLLNDPPLPVTCSFSEPPSLIRVATSTTWRRRSSSWQTTSTGTAATTWGWRWAAEGGWTMTGRTP